MSNIRLPFRWAQGAVALTGLLCPSIVAHAQGCAMCYTSAAAAKAGAIQALRSGILILLLPTLVMFAGIFVVIYRSRNRFNGVAEWSADHDREGGEMLARMDNAEGPGPRGRIASSVLRSQLSMATDPGTTDH